MLRPPPVVWALALLGFLMSVSASLVLPTYLGYDEPQHVDMVYAIAVGDGWPDPGTRFLSQGVGRSSNLYYGQRLRVRPLDQGLRATVPPRGQRRDLGEMGGDASAGGTPNQITQHPPLYYAIEAGAVKALGATSWSYDDFVQLLRVVTALLMAPLPLLVWAMADRLRAGPGTSVAAAALSLAVPGLTRVSGLVNNDGFLVITMTALLLALVHVATGDHRLRTAVLVGVLTGVTMLSKGFALIAPLLVVVAYLLDRARARAALPRLAVALAVGFAAGGFWWLRNLIVFGALQPNGYGLALARIEGPPRPANHPALLGDFLVSVQDRICRTFWGGVGLAAQPTITKTGGTILFALLGLAVLGGLLVGVRGQGQRRTLVLLLLPFPLVLAIIVQAAHGEFVQHARVPGLHGRYLYLSISGLALTTAVLLDRALGRARSALPLVAVAVALGMQAFHSRQLVRSVWLAHGRGSTLSALQAMERIAPWPPPVTYLVLLLTALTGLGTLVLSAQGAFAPVSRRPARADAAES